MTFQPILEAYGLDAADLQISPFGSGLINHTLKVSGRDAAYILQQVNTRVFKSPEAIAENLQLIGNYLQQNHPGYLFAVPLPALSGEYLVKTAGGAYYRLFPFISGSHTVNVLRQKEEAFEAARQFGKFSRLLSGFDSGRLNHTLPGFHNLGLRLSQFEEACRNAGSSRLAEAAEAIDEVKRHSTIIQDYEQLIREIPLRVVHHDTKISNVLFDTNDRGLCVIDLDTVMPGYYISDVGDMLRTYLSPADEEETDFSKIQIREDFFSAVYQGYLSEMGEILTPAEKKYFLFSGKFLMYMQALRFLSDHLNNDIYYGASYPGHNLTRARNQLHLLNKFTEAEERLRRLMR